MRALAQDRATGSPPRLRGIPGNFPIKAVFMRFTPAPAGNTRSPHRSQAARSVHPRACGEYQTDVSGSKATCGSPPRLRGIRSGTCRLSFHHRFTPAPAGNTHPAADPEHRATVHPRACGEYATSPSRPIRKTGSPPRLRGILPVVRDMGRSFRFTPAPAGNTAPSRWPTPRRTVHPRACGEYIRVAHLARSAWGSPPRLRGILGEVQHREPVIRFTPAPAGNTGRHCRAPGRPAVHPRACGEYDSCPVLSTPLRGSPPRLRGILG